MDGVKGTRRSVVGFRLSMGGTRIFELGGSEGARPRAWGAEEIVVIGLSTEEN